MTLYLVSTPIGNLEDITLRALRVLKESSLIACEDTRHTRQLLNRFGIVTPTVSYHEHNERTRTRELVERLLAGVDVALVTDAGTPGISDPGYRLVVAAIEAGVRIVPIPGVTAFVTALVASGLPTDAFLFVGFLPSRKQARRIRLEELRGERSTLVLYESPHRIREALEDAFEILGDRPAVLARELTKLHEQFRRGTLATLRQLEEAGPSRGEMVLVIAGQSGDNRTLPDDLSIAEEVEGLLSGDVSEPNEAIRLVARRRGLPRREVYRLYLEERNSGDETNDQSTQGPADDH
ncbi:MAG: 16S rRNA (cytidine(1402)-2'-O)-methyltransferase [Blastocatellia bacterium]